MSGSYLERHMREVKLALGNGRSVLIGCHACAIKNGILHPAAYQIQHLDMGTNDLYRLSRHSTNTPKVGQATCLECGSVRQYGLPGTNRDRL